jgi:hypothetical protein
VEIHNPQNGVLDINHKDAIGTIIDDDLLPLEPVANYRFDECIWNGTAGEVKDSSENAIHGKAKNGAVTKSAGVINRSAKFSKSNEQFVEINGFDNIFGTSSREFTITTWIKPNSLSIAKTNHQTKNTFLAKASDSKNDNIEIGVNPNGTLHLYLDTKAKDKYADFGNSGDIGVDEWHFIVVSYKDGKVKVQIDDNNYTNISTWAGSTIIDQAVGSPLTIGSSIHIDNYFDGFIDEVQIFDKKLTFGEINRIKNDTEEDREVQTCEEFYSISGEIYQDENSNSSFDSADIGIANVEVKLIKDINEDGIYDVGSDTEEEVMVSSTNGEYSFDNLSVGKYLVVINRDDSHVPNRYGLSGDAILSINLVNDSAHNSFAFVKGVALPVNCIENGLMFQNQPTDISYLDLATGEMLVEKEDISYNNINGAGYNKKDGYYWGYNYSKGDGTISRVGQDSNGELVVDHFKIPNLDISSYTGDIDDNGHFYIKETGNSKKVSVIDLDPDSDIYLQKIRDFELAENLNIADWGFNPQDDKLYAVNNGSGTNYLYQIEPTDGTIISKQDTNLTGRSYSFGASFFDKNGFYYIYDNGSGAIFRIDVDESPIPVPFATANTVSLNDGAMCTDIEIRFDFGDLPNNYPTTLENNGARHRIRTSVGETHYLGNDVTTENNGKPSISANRDEYDDGVKVGGVSLGGYMMNLTTDISNLTIKTHGDGYLNAWIDWNRDGEFNNTSEQIADGIDGSSGTINLSINPDNIPTVYFNGEPIYARFRYSSVEELNATGVAPDGEVEDYAIMTAHYPDIHIDEDITKVEGDNEEITEFTFRVSFDRTGSNPMLNMMNSGFYFTVKDGTATESDNDYSLPAKVDGAFIEMGGFVMVLPNQEYVDITVLVNGDSKVEQNENFELNLYSPAFMNIRKSTAIGTIINDDVLILNIERTNSTDETPQSQKESLYTQISGRDFNYAIVSYDKNSHGHSISNATIKVELVDNNSTKINDVLYKEYYYIEDEVERLDVTNSDDLIIQRATRDARFRISFLTDENGSMIKGDFSNESDYNATLNSNGEINYISRDNFAIRPATYRIEILDRDDDNSSVSYRTNDSNHTTPLNLVAEHGYRVNAKATSYNSENVAFGYRQSGTDEINVSLTFEDKLACNDKNNHKLPYRFNNGQMDEIFTHNNTGKYTLSISDSRWSAIDSITNGCIPNDSTISIDGNSRSGCNINSNFDTTHHNMRFRFQPFRFDINSTFRNINGNGKDYLYMSDLTLSKEMGVRLSSIIQAEGEKGIVLSNFTKSCMEDSVSLFLDLDFSFLSDLGLFDRTNFMLPKTISGEVLTPQQIVEFNGEINDTIGMMGKVDISKKFLDGNSGVMSVDMIYNMEKLFEEPTNPIKVNFISLELNTTNLEAEIEGEERSLNGIGAVDANRTFYFARVVSYLKYYPETDKKMIETPLFAEIFCKKIDDKEWCENNMSLKVIGKDIGHKTNRGWYLANHHDSTTDGRVIGLVSDNPMISTNYSASNSIFVEGRINGILTNYVPNTDISGEESAEIAIDTDIWLRFNKRAIAGMPLGTSSYSVTMKGASSTTGAGDAGNLMQSVHRIEHNGKMTW